MSTPAAGKADRYLVIQTAFPGDVILTLPMVQALKRARPSSQIDMLVIPSCEPLLQNHPAVSNVIVYDKRGTQSGLGGFLALTKLLRSSEYSAALIPHRSLRSALLARLARIPVRVGFDTSAGSMFMTALIHYDGNAHEWKRNTSLLGGLGILPSGVELPCLYPDKNCAQKIDEALQGLAPGRPIVGIAPGSVWKTKRGCPNVSPLSQKISLQRALK